MKLCISALVSAFILGLAFTALADTPPPDGPPKPAAEMSELKVMVGKPWKCVGQVEDSPFGPAHALQATFKCSVELAGFWVTCHFQEKKGKAAPSGMESKDAFTYDAAAKVFIRHARDSFGGWVEMTSPPPVDGAWQWTGKAHNGGQTFGMKESWSGTNTKKVTFAMEFEGEPGTWVKLQGGTCQQ
jgi:hypothetical protein